MRDSAGRAQPNRTASAWAERLLSLPVAVRLLTGLAAFILFGALLFLLPGASTRPLTFSEALFTSASALTVTGLSVITPGSDLTFLGQVFLLAQIQIGGIGLMVFTVIIFRLLGRRISVVDRMALRNTLGTLEAGAIASLVVRVLLAVLVIEAVGALILWSLWRPLLGSDRAMWFAIFHSISALCNAGFDLFSGLPGYRSIPGDAGTLTTFGVLIFIGSLGVPVVADLINLPRSRRLTLHSRLTLTMVAVMMTISTLVLFAAETLHPVALEGFPWEKRLGVALFQSVSARTAGFTPLESFETLSPAGQMVIMSVMFIGAAPASMGGGITTGTAIVLIMALWSFIRNRPLPEVGQRTISSSTVRRATAVLTISLMVVVGSTILLLLSDRALSLDGALFEVISAFATCGLTLAYTPRLNLFGRLVIILVMIWGRLGALTVMVALTRTTHQPSYYYPEEQIMIG